ncbi:MerR family transcriptional regulator [Kutzneria kofuensis]|uniref:HTH merR-type domain-containing protein n=1 Tax=Kutzneria kofuensis TaxID=103725 RepID=A0A7W9KQR7_9PSEU|nr:MerR family transcriptional regulator [Kutzneria kofuensis]MBB5896907.1 hypothetical protein [Kutzneria kofuensis]
MSLTDSTQPTWTAGTVARHLGIAESTLRSWHRRYGLAPQGSTPGRYRRYSTEDVARLRRMRDLIARGMLPSEAANTIASSLAPIGISTLVEAAQALDTARCVALVTDALAANGVVPVWDRLCRPALVALDTVQSVQPACVDSEHVLSWSVLTALHRVVGPPPAPDAPRVLLACTPNEQHTLPLEALAAALVERAVPIQMLGAATPAISIAHSLQTSAPASLVLWSQRRETADRDVLRAVLPSSARVVLAGPGWNGLRSRPSGAAGSSRVTSLPDALNALV